MADNENGSFTETTSESWGSRIMGSIKGIGTGFLLVIVAFVVLWWNEGRSVRVYKALQEGKGAVVEAKADAVDPNNQGKLIHVAGKITSEGTLKDPDFSVEAEKKLALRRTVEMYQWQERCTSTTEKKLGGGTETKTECKYEKGWSSSEVDSSQFRKASPERKNPAMQYKSKTILAEDAKLGAYKVPTSLLGSLNQFSAFPNSDKLVGQVKATLKKNAVARDDWIYVGNDPANPQVGDYRIRFEQMGTTDASVIAAQHGDTFGAYRTKNGETILMIQPGIIPAQQMFQTAEESNQTMTWILRFVGVILMFIGLKMILTPLETLLDVVPILGSIVGVGISLAAGVVAIVLSLITIAIAWLFYRPVLSIILIAVGVGAFFGVQFLKKRAPQKAPA
ncbi:MAG: TMEM43 family protein [Turneriella sp.]|nr:TMEM43 family protein [Turneriella sp.]